MFLSLVRLDFFKINFLKQEFSSIRSPNRHQYFFLHFFVSVMIFEWSHCTLCLVGTTSLDFFCSLIYWMFCLNLFMC